MRMHVAAHRKFRSHILNATPQLGQAIEYVHLQSIVIRLIVTDSSSANHLSSRLVVSQNTYGNSNSKLEIGMHMWT